ncbi:MAG: ATP-binding cassette domain-containing protein [Blautia sp.]|nr:ATP-binding cassette domain-containing protein [Blautia sp.]
MTEIVFKASGLTKKYLKPGFGPGWMTPVLDHFNMEIRRGEIYGFVGSNGAGKTTLIRILAGFARPTGGRLELFGEEDPRKLYLQRRRINGIIEKPAIYPHLTAKDNLEVCRLQRGIRGTQCITEILKAVDLSDTGHKKAKNFSLGMKQRLGIAMALLGEPEFLFLDEPINGLDPEGMAALRELLGRLHRERGITILISSHLLSELHQLATCYGFIHDGKMLEQITSEELDRKCGKYLHIKVDQAAKAEAFLRKTFQLHNLETVPNNEINAYDIPDQLESGEICKALIQAGIHVKTVAVKDTDLEKYYLSLIGRTTK